MRKPHLYHLSRLSRNLLYIAILGDFEHFFTDHDVISPGKVLYQLKGHLFVTLNFEFFFIYGKGSRLNYFFSIRLVISIHKLEEISQDSLSILIVFNLNENNKINSGKVVE